MTPEEIRAALDQGRRYADSRLFSQAVETWTKILPHQRNNHTLYAGIGHCLVELRKFKDAALYYRVAVNMRPDFIPGIIGYADSLVYAGKADKALKLLDKARKHFKPETEDYGIYLGCKANAYKVKGQYLQASEIFAKALELAPTYAGLWTSAGNMMTIEGKLDEAGMCYQRAVDLDPNLITYNNLSSHLLNIGQWDQAWHVHERRLTNPNYPIGVVGKPWWNGSRMPGRLAVFTEQGHGDLFMFCRYLEATKWLVRDLTLVVVRSQYEIVQRFNLGCRVVTDIHAGEFDAQCALMSLPFLLDMPYMNRVPPPPSVTAYPVEHPRRPAVALAWLGNPENPNNAIRNVPLKALMPMIRSRPDIYWFTCLPEQDVTDDIKRLGLPIEQLLGSWAETADRLAGADLMLTVDTGSAHLAGTLGIPTWILLASFSDWRWGANIGIHTGPWYKNARYYRQDKEESWDEVLKPVAQDLRTFLPSSSKQPA